MSTRVIIIGAGEAGSMIAREIASHSASGLEVVGFLDDNSALVGTVVEGHRVLGRCDDLAAVSARIHVDQAIIAVPSGSREFIRHVIGLCRDAGISFKIVPGLIEIIRGTVRLAQIREVHPEDLLGRETVEFDDTEVGKELAGRRVMVTGAGGSIGGEICRQLQRFSLGELQLFGRGENQIYEIERELRLRNPAARVRSVIGDIRDRRCLVQTFRRFRPEFVYHAAAHKHVHYMEAFPVEAIKNNVFGTMNVIDASRETGVERVVMLSTDKAVKPAGVMGASKRIAEYLLAQASRDGRSPRCIAVRFGNVLGSRGSVVPLFISQIRAGGPVTVSDPEATRFFMTLKEACMLVVQASVMGAGGEILILRMGTPIKIIEMAKDLIALHGLRPEEDIRIEISGLRDGEKLHEDLVADGEQVADSAHAQILVARPSLPRNWDIDDILARLRELSDNGDGDGIRALLAQVIPDARMRKLPATDPTIHRSGNT
jgi:FlaA1/EpsC-like NDP-sugar epimerase